MARLVFLYVTRCTGLAARAGPTAADGLRSRGVRIGSQPFWLHGHDGDRYPRCLHAPPADRLREVLATPGPLMVGAYAAGVRPETVLAGPA